tara:strand:- start:196 stop:444 length:249 start_codon:yes stop_codon:yes gene_type:complete
MTREEHNGWTNRETWAAHLWITNEESLYASALHANTGLLLKEYMEELLSLRQESETLQIMFDDIGSLWRVNWKEIHDAIKED